MGLLSDHLSATVDGVDIEVEARTGGSGKTEYDLVVNNSRVDRIEGFFGKFILRGELRTSRGDARPIRIEIKQGLFGTKYQAFVDGQPVTLKKLA